METRWETRFADRTKVLMSSAIREILKYTQIPNLISFAGGLPSPDVFPIEEFKAACQNVLDTQGSKALQYSITEGNIPLREYLVAPFLTLIAFTIPSFLTLNALDHLPCETNIHSPTLTSSCLFPIAYTFAHLG